MPPNSYPLSGEVYLFVGAKGLRSIWCPGHYRRCKDLLGIFSSPGWFLHEGDKLNDSNVSLSCSRSRPRTSTWGRGNRDWRSSRVGVSRWHGFRSHHRRRRGCFKAVSPRRNVTSLDPGQARVPSSESCRRGRRGRSAEKGGGGKAPPAPPPTSPSAPAAPRLGPASVPRPPGPPPPSTPTPLPRPCRWGRAGRAPGPAGGSSSNHSSTLDTYWTPRRSPSVQGAGRGPLPSARRGRRRGFGRPPGGPGPGLDPPPQGTRRTRPHAPRPSPGKHTRTRSGPPRRQEDEPGRPFDPLGTRATRDSTDPSAGSSSTPPKPRTRVPSPVCRQLWAQAPGGRGQPRVCSYAAPQAA